METKYVRITKADNSDSWYFGHAGAIWKVLREDEGTYTVKIDGHLHYYIHKSDCEVVPLPSQQPQIYEQDKETLAKTFANKEVPEHLAAHHNALSEVSFKAGYDAGYQARESEGAGEGQHRITTEQLRALHTAIKIQGEVIQPMKILEEWFPTVFAPAKTTYKNGDLIQIDVEPDPHRVVVAYVDKPMFFLLRDDGKVWHHLAEMENPDTITEAEMKEYVGKYEFTLLPGTTDQMV